MEERDYPKGLDCVWIGSDRAGHVAAFVTGGEAPIPAYALKLNRTSIEAIEGELHVLPLTAGASLLVPLNRPDDFMELARRGFFAYDWTDAHRTLSEARYAYELIAAPEKPILAEELPTEIAALLDGMSLNVVFTEDRAIDVTKHLRCRTASPY